MDHPSFENAGANPGIEIWTIDKFEPVAIDSKMHGKFFNADSYIVLKTSGKNNSSLSYDAHFWLGAKTTQDKKGTAAILTVTLDDMLGGKAVHHREVQGHESGQFLGYFKPAISYLEGGTESGFNEVETNAGAEKRLLKLSGSDNMRIEEVPADSSSLTKDHCFILEVDHDIFVLMPEGAKATQRRKILSAANNLRDDRHNGRATVHIVDEFSADEDIAEFFDALGSGSKDDLADDDSSETYTRASVSTVYLYKVVQGDDIELEPIKKPYKQKQLASDEVYILDTPCSGVYIWLGGDVADEVKKQYNQMVQQYLEMKEYPSWVNITKVRQGQECANFQQYFNQWDTVTKNNAVSESDAGYFSSDADEVAAAAFLIGKSAPARGYMPDQGDGSLQVTRLAGDQEDVTEKLQGEVSVLFRTEAYVIRYKYDNDGTDGYVIYIWVGSESSAEDRAAAIELAREIEDELDGNATVVQVPEGKEPKHFLSIFKGNLAIAFGGKDNDYKPTNSKGTYEEDGIRMFRVEGTELGVDMRAVQVLESAEVLEDDDVFVLEVPDAVYVWNGSESSKKEQEVALSFVKSVVVSVDSEKDVVVVPQGDEPEEFWDALGGPPSESEERSGWRATVSRRVTVPPSLTAATVTVGGKIKFEELSSEFTQQELSDDGVYILDAGEEIYLWQGSKIPERVRMARIKIISEYIVDDGLDRTVDTTIVVNVKQGIEPAVFKKQFPEWDNDMWENQTSYDDMKNEMNASNHQ